MAHEFLSKINWVGLFYFAIAIVAVAVVQKVLDIKITDFIAELIREFKELGAANLSRASINALGIIIFAAAIFMYWFFDSFRTIIEIFNTVKGHESNNFVEFAVSIFMFGVMALLSTLTIRQ